MNSDKIVPALESHYPFPPLYYEAKFLQDIEDMRSKAILPILPVWMCPVPELLLAPRSKEYFEETREKQHGKPVSQIAAEGVTDEKWEESKKAWMEIAQRLKENGGPFFWGDKCKFIHDFSYSKLLKTALLVSYADLFIVGTLQMFKQAAEEKAFNRVVAFDPALQKLYDSCKPFIEKSN
jgi:hypothetical protein